MATVDENSSIVDMLARNEELIAELYSFYAGKFPEQHDFWAQLADDEMDHRNSIRAYSASKGSDDYFTEERFDRTILSTSLKYMREKIEEAEDEQFSHDDALAIALAIETNIIERNFFKIFDDDPEAVKETLEKLSNDTGRHADVVRQAIASNSKKRP